MAPADELERRMVEFRSGRPPKGALPVELQPALLAALHRPTLAGLDLIYLTGEVRHVSAGAPMHAAFRRAILDASLARAVRGRFAHLLATSDEEGESWLEVANELGDDELTLAFEGHLAILFTLLHLGMEHGRDLAGLLLSCVEDRFDEVAPVIEPVRAAIGVEPSLVYRPVFEEDRLRMFWPSLAPALAAERSPEALAVLDLGLLRAPDSTEADALRTARAALLERMPARLPRALPQGEMYLCPPDPEGHWLGLLALRRGSANEIHPFDLVAGSHVDLRESDKMPAQATRGLVTTVALPAAIEVPFLEGLALFRYFASGPRTGNPAQWAGLDRTLRDLPELEPIPPGAPFSEPEIVALVESEPRALWKLDPEQVGQLLQLFIQMGEGEGLGDRELLARLMLRLEVSARWLSWTNRVEEARRLSAHCVRPDDAESLQPFLGFAAHWVTRESQRFVEETNARKAQS